MTHIHKSGMIVVKSQKRGSTLEVTNMYTGYEIEQFMIYHWAYFIKHFQPVEIFSDSVHRQKTVQKATSKYLDTVSACVC